MEKEAARAKRAVNLVRGAKVQTPQRALHITHINTLKGNEVYDIPLLSPEMEALKKAELDIDLWDKLYSKIEDLTGVVDASYSEKFGSSIMIQIEKQLDNAALHHTILNMVAVHINQCRIHVGRLE